MASICPSLALGAVLLSGAADAATFDIDFVLPDEATAQQRGVAAAVRDFWTGLILGYRDDAVRAPVRIAVGAARIDGADGTLAYASPTAFDGAGPFVLPEAGEVTFDLDDFDLLAPSLAQEEEIWLFNTLLHEVAHVLGFGTLWEANGVYQLGSGRYTGAAGVAAYRAEFDPLAHFVPTELEGGAGMAEAHWASDWAGFSNELMRGEASPSPLLSFTTIASFRDLGYRTVAFAPVPLPAGVWLGIGAFAALGAVARRRGTAAESAALAG